MKLLCLKYNELSLDQLYDIMALRQKIFVVEQNCAYLDADGKDKLAWHVMLEVDGELLAYTRLLDKGISYPTYISIGRVVCDEQARGKGYGKKIMEFSIEKCLSLFPSETIKISAQVYLLAFYISLGFEEIGERYLEDGIPHAGMIYIPK